MREAFWKKVKSSSQKGIAEGIFLKGAIMPIGREKEVVRTCPFKAGTGPSTGEIGRSTNPKEMCSHACGLYDEATQACSIRVIAMGIGPILAAIKGPEEKINQ
jgi:hypothetical protein